MKMVYVGWTDASSEHEWVSLGDLPVPSQVVSVGFLIDDGGDHVVVCGTYAEGSDKEYSECIAIPRGCIVDMHDLWVMDND